MGDFFRAILPFIALAMILAMIGLFFIYRRLQFLTIPFDADLRETLLRVPFGLVVVLDLLDLGFDFLAAPFVWILLGRFNLHGLRKLTTIEALIPGTQLIPTMTASWLFVRLLPRKPTPTEQGRTIDDQTPNKY